MVKTRSIGTVLSMEIDGEWEAVAQIRDIAGPTLSKSTRELTGPDDAPDGWRRFGGSWKTGGEVLLDLWWDKDEETHDENTGLLSRFLADGTEDYLITWPEGTTAAFSAEVVSHEPVQALGSVLRLRAVLQISGEVEWT